MPDCTKCTHNEYCLERTDGGKYCPLHYIGGPTFNDPLQKALCDCKSIERTLLALMAARTMPVSDAEIPLPKSLGQSPPRAARLKKVGRASLIPELQWLGKPEQFEQLFDLLKQHKFIEARWRYGSKLKSINRGIRVTWLKSNIVLAHFVKTLVKGHRLNSSNAWPAVAATFNDAKGKPMNAHSLGVLACNTVQQSQAVADLQLLTELIYQVWPQARQLHEGTNQEVL